MSGHGDPGLARGLAAAGPLLDRLDVAFTDLDWMIPAGGLAGGVPPRAMRPSALRGWLLAPGTGYQQRDTAWAAVVAAARGTGPDAAGYRFLAVGLALYGLGGWGHRIRVWSAQEVPDIHADLVTGFLTRLASVDTDRANIAGRLIDSAIGYAARRHRTHQARPRPVDANLRCGPDPHTQGWDAGLQACLQRAAARLADLGQPVHPGDLELIAATRIDRHPLSQVAATLGLSVDAAYKRRQRAERRLATILLPPRSPRTLDPDSPPPCDR